MLSEMKLVISTNDKVLQTVTSKMDPNSFVKSIATFQQVANETLTNMIEELGDIAKVEEAEEDDSDDDDEDIDASPKKRKK